MLTVKEILEARAYYHRIRTAPAKTLAARGNQELEPAHRIIRAREAARHAIDRLNRMLVDVWVSRLTPPPPAQDEICIGSQVYCLTFSANGYHRYVPREDFIPEAKRIVSTDVRGRLLAELHESAGIQEALKDAEYWGVEPDEPRKEREIA